MTYYHNIALSKNYINLIRFVKKGEVLLQSTCASPAVMLGLLMISILD